MRMSCLDPKTPSFSIYRNNSPSSASTSSSSKTTASSCIAFIDSAEALIQKWNPETSAYAKVTSLFYNDKTEAMQYIQCVNKLQRAMHSLLAQNPSSPKLILAQNLMQIAMKRLQKEFYQILSMNRAYLDPESVTTTGSSSSRTSFSSYDDGGTTDDDVREAGDSITELERVSSEHVADLKSIVDCMVSNGYAKECVSVYTTMRKSIVDEAIYRLNVEEYSFSKVNKMHWDVLEMKIKSWLEAVKISVRTLFAGERILCDSIFGAASRSIAEACFAEISRDGASLLFRFAEHIVKTKKSHPEKIFRMLDMYAAITVLLPEIESIFSFNSTAAVRSQAFDLQIRLVESIRMILSEFENSMVKDSTKSPANFAGVHSLTTRTMQYLTTLADYSNVLSEIFLDVPPPLKSELPESYLYSPESDNTTVPSSEFSVRIAWLIQALLCKIDGKTKHYCKNVSLSYLFLANNLRHVVAKVRESNLHYVVGDDWILNHDAKVKRLIVSYERVAWGNVLSSLPENPTELSPEEARVVFTKFNSEFEKAYRKQNVLVLPEQKFRGEITASLERKIIPIYRELYDTHRNAGVSVKEMSEYVVFTPQDVQNYLLNLFIR